MFSKTNCSICKNSFFSNIYSFSDQKIRQLKNINKKLEKFDEIYNIVRCNKCGFVYLNPRLQKEELEDLYNQMYKTGVYINHLTNQQRKIRNIESLNRIKRIIKEIKKERINVLDIGTSDGSFLFSFKNSYSGKFNLFGIDTHTNNLVKDGVTIINDDFINYDFGFKFDLVTLFDGIEHVYDLPQTIKKIFLSLNNNGHLVLVTPNYNSILRKINKDKWGMFLAEHLYYFTPYSLTNLLRLYGFKDIEVRFVNRYFFSKIFLNKIKLSFNRSKTSKDETQISVTQDKSLIRYLKLGFLLLINDIFGMLFNEGDNMIAFAKK